MAKTIIVACILSISTGLFAQRNCREAFQRVETKRFAELPDDCPTPDAFAISPDGSLFLSCPNYADNSLPGLLVRVNSDGTIIRIAEVPGIDLGTSARPMGIDFAPDGSLYVCANPRILRYSFVNDSVAQIETIAEGINGPNGLKINGDNLFVTVPKLPKINTAKNTSGVYRFKLTDRNIEVKSDSTDSNLLFTTQTQNPKRQFGLDGIAFDHSGDLYVGDFGDAIIYKLKLSETGTIESKEVYTTFPDSTGIDGMIFDQDGNLYVTGFSQNQLWKIDNNRKASIIADYPDNDGCHGELDQPVDLTIWEDKLIISNFDLMTGEGFVNTAHSKPYTLSFIPLRDEDIKR
ncbi:SMP-30/gluconolactonase/LRE family protein [Mangrovibacterium sp.]|uniref:SMP-30/gluconolactonase/LRE family protein n=1 Tax=Mangrovibacterium sp. TaxID=1961364 RepID=UPI00356A3DB1